MGFDTTQVYNGSLSPYNVAGRDDAAGFVQSMELADGAVFDAFGRLRVSNPQTLFESSFEYDLQSLWFEQVTANSGTITHNSNLRSAILTATSTSGSSAYIQTRNYWPYEKGKSQLIKATFVLGSATTSITKRVGYFDAANGVFLEQAGDGTLNIVLRSSVSGSPVDTQVAQAAWNVDPLNGSGPSGITLDVTKQQILVIDAQFLGAGRIRVGFNLNGVTIVAHQFLNANVNATGPYMQTFNLPVRYEIAASGVTIGDTLQAICCDVESEGGVGSPNGFVFAAGNVTGRATSTSRTALLAIRPAATYNSIVNRQFIIPELLSVYAATEAHIIEVFYDSTLTGGSWVAADAASAIEYNIGASISAVGKRVGILYVAASAQGNQVRPGSAAAQIGSAFPLTLDYAGGNPKNLMITATTLTGTGSALAGLSWKEIR